MQRRIEDEQDGKRAGGAVERGLPHSCRTAALTGSGSSPDSVAAHFRSILPAARRLARRAAEGRWRAAQP